jgi:PhzF family phenazine biosynthesis protein
MQQRPFKQVDVFTATPYYGNPLAVVLDGTGLSTEDMQHFARWTNLSETTFLLPPTAEGTARGADYQVRIFTTAYEMPFAGHPTLGSCHAWLEHGGVPKTPGIVVQECKVGLVKIRQLAAARRAFAAPALRHSHAAPELVQALADALCIPRSAVLASQHLNNGPSHFGLLLDSQQRVLDLSPDFVQLRAAMQGAAITGVGLASVDVDAGPAALISRSNREARAFVGSSAPAATVGGSHDEPSVEVRFFFDHGHGVGEDPVTGSFNASLAQWLIAEGHAPHDYTAAQGTCIGVQGRVHIQQDASGQVWVGGDAVTCISGTVTL